MPLPQRKIPGQVLTAHDVNVLSDLARNAATAVPGTGLVGGENAVALAPQPMQMDPQLTDDSNVVESQLDDWRNVYKLTEIHAHKAARNAPTILSARQPAHHGISRVGVTQIQGSTGDVVPVMTLPTTIVKVSDATLQGGERLGTCPTNGLGYRNKAGPIRVLSLLPFDADWDEVDRRACLVEITHQRLQHVYCLDNLTPGGEVAGPFTTIIWGEDYVCTVVEPGFVEVRPAAAPAEALQANPVDVPTHLAIFGNNPGDHEVVAQYHFGVTVGCTGSRNRLLFTDTINDLYDDTLLVGDNFFSIAQSQSQTRSASGSRSESKSGSASQSQLSQSRSVSQSRSASKSREASQGSVSRSQSASASRSASQSQSKSQSKVSQSRSKSQSRSQSASRSRSRLVSQLSSQASSRLRSQESSEAKSQLSSQASRAQSSQASLARTSQASSRQHSQWSSVAWSQSQESSQARSQSRESSQARSQSGSKSEVESRLSSQAKSQSGSKSEVKSQESSQMRSRSGSKSEVRSQERSQSQSKSRERSRSASQLASQSRSKSQSKSRSKSRSQSKWSVLLQYCTDVYHYYEQEDCAGDFDVLPIQCTMTEGCVNGTGESWLFTRWSDPEKTCTDAGDC